MNLRRISPSRDVNSSVYEKACRNKTTSLKNYYCPVNEFNRLCRTVLFPHKPLSRETDLFPAVANAVLDSELNY